MQAFTTSLWTLIWALREGNLKSKIETILKVAEHYNTGFKVLASHPSAGLKKRFIQGPHGGCISTNEGKVLKCSCSRAALSKTGLKRRDKVSKMLQVK